jgi:hypothetical protein
MDEVVGVKHLRLIRPVQPPRSAFTGFRFPHEVILIAVRWYLRYGLTYRDLEELLAERGIEVDHVTLFRWVQRFTPLLITRPGPAATAWVVTGSSTRPTSRFRGPGDTSTGPLTNTGRSSTCSCRRRVT